MRARSRTLGSIVRGADGVGSNVIGSGERSVDARARLSWASLRSASSRRSSMRAALLSS